MLLIGAIGSLYNVTVVEWGSSWKAIKSGPHTVPGGGKCSSITIRPTITNYINHVAGTLDCLALPQVESATQRRATSGFLSAIAIACLMLVLLYLFIKRGAGNWVMRYFRNRKSQSFNPSKIVTSGSRRRASGYGAIPTRDPDEGSFILSPLTPPGDEDV